MTSILDLKSEMRMNFFPTIYLVERHIKTARETRSRIYVRPNQMLAELNEKSCETVPSKCLIHSNIAQVAVARLKSLYICCL